MVHRILDTENSVYAHFYLQKIRFTGHVLYPDFLSDIRIAIGSLWKCIKSRSVMSVGPNVPIKMHSRTRVPWYEKQKDSPLVKDRLKIRYWQAVTANDCPFKRPFTCSGAMYFSVPTKADLVVEDCDVSEIDTNPKSPITNWFCSLVKMLPG